jgi:hypothetical protein
VLRDHANHAPTRVFQGASRGAPPANQCAPTTVTTDTASHEQAIINIVNQLAHSCKRRIGKDRLIDAKICFDVDLVAVRTNKASLALCTKHEPKGTSEDRLARSGLAGNYRHPGRGLNFRRAEHDEVIDAKPLQHGQWPNLSR